MNWEKEAMFIRDMAIKNNEMYGESLPMIASENIISPMCEEMLISDFHGRYAEGTPGQRYYQGCKWFDEVEKKGVELAQRLFDCAYADIRPTSGTVANMAVFKALAQPGTRVTVLDTASGAHISYGKWGAAGLRGLELYTYPFDDERMIIDIDGAVKIIQEVQPELTLLGQSVFLFPTPLEDLAAAAHDVGAKVIYDAAHVLGLIAGGQFQKPLKEGADVMTGSTHKTLPGPQGGMILTDTSREEAKWVKQLDWGVFPGVTSSYHLHHVAAKAIAFAEHLAFGQDYAAQIVANAQKLAASLYDLDFEVLGANYGFTQSHQIVFKVGEKKGAWAAEQLEKAGIIANMNMVPEDEHPLHPSGIRLGVQELTRLGMKEGEMQDVALFFKRVLKNKEDAASVRSDVFTLKKQYRAIHYCFQKGKDPYKFISLIK